MSDYILRTQRYDGKSLLEVVDGSTPAVVRDAALDALLDRKLSVRNPGPRQYHPSETSYWLMVENRLRAYDSQDQELGNGPAPPFPRSGTSQLADVINVGTDVLVQRERIIMTGPVGYREPQHAESRPYWCRARVIATPSELLSDGKVISLEQRAAVLLNPDAVPGDGKFQLASSGACWRDGLLMPTVFAGPPAPLAGMHRSIAEGKAIIVEKSPGRWALFKAAL